MGHPPVKPVLHVYSVEQSMAMAVAVAVAVAVAIEAEHGLDIPSIAASPNMASGYGSIYMIVLGGRRILPLRVHTQVDCLVRVVDQQVKIK